MYIDGIIIFLGAVSLTNYSSTFMPSLHVVMTTIEHFIYNMFFKTLLLIVSIYIFLAFMASYLLNSYQYGFTDILYALLRSCIVFLNGFMLNE